MAVVHIGIGSNLGNRQENCLEAIRLLGEHGIKVIKRSSMIETEPWGVKDQPRFINMAVEVETELTPEELLKLLKVIEKDMGREATVHWGPRNIDLDILFFNDLVIDTEELKIPHPYLQERQFVLEPLAEISPEKVHPVFRKTIRDLRRGLL
jgi:2-amino-4-hydroxy-6-hydroxymethyldihydropteridine diphosphokinase